MTVRRRFERNELATARYSRGTARAPSAVLRMIEKIAAKTTVASRAGASMPILLMSVSPAREAVLDALADPGQPDAEQTDHQDHAEHAAGVEILRRHHDDLTEPRGTQEEFRRDHADKPAPDGLP